ncbi:MAG TPA: type II secretion system protein [Burkholderiales bacterium]
MVGFTITELVTVLIIAGVIAAVALPRFAATTYGEDELRLYDQTFAALRYAQRVATTMQRNVCVTFTSTQLSLTYGSTYGGACNTGLAGPGGESAPYTVSAQGSASYTSASTFSYDRVGRPSPSQTITISGGKQIAVEPETGYVH